MRPPEQDPRTALARQRRRQGGAVTRAQALQAGCSRADVATLLRRGTWVDLQRGVYVDGAELAGADVWAEHALHVAARSLALGGGHAASRRSASLVLGLPLLGPPPAVPELVRAPRRRSDHSSSRSVRVAALPPQDVVRWRDVDATAPARLVCDSPARPGRSRR